MVVMALMPDGTCWVDLWRFAVRSLVFVFCGAIGLDPILASVGLLPQGGARLSDAWQMLYASAHRETILTLICVNLNKVSCSNTVSLLYG